MTSPPVPFDRHLRRLEDENRRLRDLVASLRQDRADYHEFVREEVRRCSNP